MQIKHVRTPKTEGSEFFSHAAAKLVRNTALQGEGITLVLANCVPVREQHLDSAMLEVCHSSGKMCVKWLESKKSL